MIVIINIILMFIYLYLLLKNNILNKYGTSMLNQNLILFVAVFVFQFVTRVADSYLQKCQINLRNIIKNSLNSATLAVVGHILYTQFLKQKIPQEMKTKFLPTQSELVIKTISIIMSIIAFKLIEFIFHNDNTGCRVSEPTDIIGELKNLQDITVNKLKDEITEIKNNIK